MTTNFPGAIDDFTNPTGSALTGSAPPIRHSEQHANANDAIEAIETVIGVTGSADSASIEKRLTDVIAESATTSSSLSTHESDTSNPHTVTAAQVGADAAGTASTEISAHASGTGVHAIASTTGLQSALDAKAPAASPTFTGTVGGITAAMVGAPSGSGTSTGTNTGDSATPAETTTTIGTLIDSSSSKTTPIDADKIGIWNSVSGLLESLPWANLKDTLSSIFALLAGKAGGQTVVGGTGTGENLTLQSTSHATRGKVLLGSGSAYDEVNDRLVVGGTASTAKLSSLSIYEQLRLSYDAGNYTSFTVGNGGSLTISSSGSAEVLAIRSDGNFGVGSYGSSTAKVKFDYTTSNTGATVYVCQAVLNYGAGSSGTQSNTTYGQYYNVQTDATYSGNVTGKVYGSKGVLNHYGSGTITNALGFASQINNRNAGVITNCRTIAAEKTNNLGAGSITNIYGMYVYDHSGVGTSVSHNIFSEGSASSNIFEGSVDVYGAFRCAYSSSVYESSSTNSVGKTTKTLVGSAPSIAWTVSDATANAIYDVATFSKNSAGAGAAGLGVRINLAAKSSTTVDTVFGAVSASIVDATHATRKGKTLVLAGDWTGLREGFCAEADGTKIKTSVNGVAAVARAAALSAEIPGDATRDELRLTELYNACKAFGIIN